MTSIQKEFIKFGLVGIAGFVVDAGFLYILKSPLDPYLARLFSFFCAVCATWILNRTFTFNIAARPKSILKEFISYVMSMLVGGGVNLAVYSLVVVMLGKSAGYLLIALALGSIAGMVFNFAISKLLIFKAR